MPEFETYKNLPPEKRLALIDEQLAGMKFGELTITVRYGRIVGYAYKGEQKFFDSKPATPGESDGGTSKRQEQTGQERQS